MLERVPVLRRERREERATEVKGRERPSRVEGVKGATREEKVEEKSASSCWLVNTRWPSFDTRNKSWTRGTDQFSELNQVQPGHHEPTPAR